MSYGHSCIVDPWGIVIAQASGGTRVIFADLDSKAIENARKKIPVLDHARQAKFS